MQRALEQEASQPGVRNPWTVVGPGAAAATLRGVGSSGSSESSCQICKDLNTLYEAGLPQFTSRMAGQQLRATVPGPDSTQRHASPVCGPVLCCRAGCGPGLPP